MSREIKFRAWDKDDKRMFQNVTVGNKLAVIVWDEEDEEMTYYTTTPTNGSFEFMQFTGLLDLHGKEIYEGDILEAGNGSMRHRSAGVMEWHNDKGKWTEFSPLNRFEVIGNIYEHPDLLK